MRLQIIKSVEGKDEYVLIPIHVYRALQEEIEEELSELSSKSEYVPFHPEDYVDNPIALARIKAHITQEELAKRMKVSQAYISKLEGQSSVTPKVLSKVRTVLMKKKIK